jgi:allantoinase
MCHSGIHDFPNATESDLRRVLPNLAEAGIPLLVHAEMVSNLSAGIEERFVKAPTSYAAYLATRPTTWEVEAIRLLIDLSREYRAPIHIVHLSASIEARPLLLAAKSEGLPITVETCPHYLCLAAEEIPDADPRFKCAPPIREAVYRETLRAMLASGELDTLGSDHSPAPPALKHLDTGDLRNAWGGIASLQLLLPLSWSVSTDHARLVRALTSRPAQLVGLEGRKGSIAPDRDADFVIFDPNQSFVVQPAMLQHRHPATPYEGRTLQGVVTTTYLRGRRIFDNGIFLEPPTGTLQRRHRP